MVGRNYSLEEGHPGCDLAAPTAARTRDESHKHCFHHNRQWESATWQALWPPFSLHKRVPEGSERHGLRAWSQRGAQGVAHVDIMSAAQNNCPTWRYVTQPPGR